MSITADILRIRGTAEYEAARYRGLWQRSRERLEQERAFHAEELRRVDCLHRQQLQELVQSLFTRFEDEFERRFSELGSRHEKEVQGYRQHIAELKSELCLYRDRVEGKNHKEDLCFSGDRVHSHKSRRKGGKKPGTRGGRLLHCELPVVDEAIELEEDQRRCPSCGLPYAPMNSSEDSERVEWEYRLVRIRTRRGTYHRSCQCTGVPSILTAPTMPRAMAHSKYGDRFWTEILINKYAYQIPTEVTCELLAGHGLTGVRPQTLSAGIERACCLLEPLSEAIEGHNRQSTLNQTDESSIAVFVDSGHKEYFYQYTTIDTVVYKHTASRSGEEVAAYFASSCQRSA